MMMADEKEARHFVQQQHNATHQPGPPAAVVSNLHVN